MILNNREKLEIIAQMLLERESLSSEDINDILAGRELKPLNNVDNTEKQEPVTESADGDDTKTPEEGEQENK